MRKSVIGAVIVALLSNQAMAADWKHVANSTAGATTSAMKWYITPGTQTGNIVRQEVLVNLETPVDTKTKTGTPYALSSGLMTYEFNCHLGNQRQISERHYSELNGGGTAKTESTIGEWTYTRSPVEAILFKHSCPQVAAVAPAPAVRDTGWDYLNNPAPAPVSASASAYNPDPTNVPNSAYASTSGPSGSEAVGDALGIALIIGGAVLGGYVGARTPTYSAPAYVPVHAPRDCLVMGMGNDMAHVSCH